MKTKKRSDGFVSRFLMMVPKRYRSDELCRIREARFEMNRYSVMEVTMVDAFIQSARSGLLLFSEEAMTLLVAEGMER